MGESLRIASRYSKFARLMPGTSSQNILPNGGSMVIYHGTETPLLKLYKFTDLAKMYGS